MRNHRGLDKNIVFLPTFWRLRNPSSGEIMEKSLMLASENMVRKNNRGQPPRSVIWTPREQPMYDERWGCRSWGHRWALCGRGWSLTPPEVRLRRVLLLLLTQWFHCQYVAPGAERREGGPSAEIMFVGFYCLVLAFFLKCIDVLTSAKFWSSQL